jgi:hypothetical protein
VGDGSQISFWHDTWCGDQPLKESYPELYRIARNKEAWVSDNMQILNEAIHWNFIFFEKLKIGRWRWCWHFTVNCMRPGVMWGGGGGGGSDLLDSFQEEVF